MSSAPVTLEGLETITAATAARMNFTAEENIGNAEAGSALPTGGVVDPAKISSIDAAVFSNSVNPGTESNGVAGLPPQTVIDANETAPTFDLGGNLDEG